MLVPMSKVLLIRIGDLLLYIVHDPVASDDLSHLRLGLKLGDAVAKVVIQCLGL